METIGFGILLSILGLSIYLFQIDLLVQGFSKKVIIDKPKLCRIGGLYTLFPIGLLFILISNIDDPKIYFSILLLILIILGLGILLVDIKCTQKQTKHH
ncbi:hypothetical protein [Macrococcus sp. DPC7161]|uniref:hypothetical protein n=1 Tax=Macrococcus sp. DPC7161 TaxID=2507060 RepID=UPI00100AA881|nr:hypothetical protein [Macrococcus sp. DPC7161]RXK18415.1 hypothetical protein ER639_03825 [Macrococcus sp. DPC7161]